MADRGAFVDEKGVRWDTNDADYEGYLQKKSKWMGEWRKRYLILKGSKVFFAKANKTPPHGMIDLVDCVHVKSADTKSKKRYALEIALKNEQFLLVATSDRDKDEWISRIGKAIVRHSSMFDGDTYAEESSSERKA